MGRLNLDSRKDPIGRRKNPGYIHSDIYADGTKENSFLDLHVGELNLICVKKIGTVELINVLRQCKSLGHLNVQDILKGVKHKAIEELIEECRKN